MKVSAPSLDAVVQSALREGRWSGSPKIGDFRVVNGTIEVSVTAQVEIPPDVASPELVGAIVGGDPRSGLDLVVEYPSLMGSLPPVLAKDIPFSSLPKTQFKSLIKRMGNLSQYSDGLLMALVEGRSSGWVQDALYHYWWSFTPEPGALAQMVGGDKGEVDDWDDSVNVEVSGGVVRGELSVPIIWKNPRGLTIKMNLDQTPYVTLDPKVHGTEELRESQILADMGAKFSVAEGRLAVLPKGTPGIIGVSLFDTFPMKPFPLKSMSRKELENFVRMMASS